MNAAFAVYETPLGALLVEECEDRLTYLSILPYGGDSDSEDEDNPFNHPNEFTDMVYAQVMEYLAGERTQFDIDIDLSHCTPFQVAVYNELLKVPYGSTYSYKEIAIAIGNPQASRAVGAACNHNPILLIVPCHRVISTRGAYTGYAAGIGTKIALLSLEKGERRLI